MQKKHKTDRRVNPNLQPLFRPAVALGAAALALLEVPQVAAQQTERQLGSLEEVVVTARRREEMLSDVPVSMTVFNQDQIDDANITNMSDLATYTPSLQVNNRFGADNATFAIRGFQQELRTTASVGVYFAEVVALRGANSQQSGDGSPPGDLYDLASVQVLKGPQGTLFGRNTTGGAILLTPNRPTEEFGGYIEGSAGNYDMLRGQGVVNIPATDNLKLRLGIDTQERDGYLDNFSGIGPDDFANVDYNSYRGSVVWTITDTLENYTIFRYSASDNNGYPGSIFECNPAQPLGNFCQPDLDARKKAGKDDFYDIYSFVPDPVNKQDIWQGINTTTWEFTDNYLLKNILAFGSLETKQRGAVFGTDWSALVQPASLIFQQVGLSDAFPTTSQETLVEELQIQGESLDELLTWQAGVYFERSSPDGQYGAQSPALISCDQDSITSANPEDFRCNDILGVGAVQSTPGGVKYNNEAVYGQGTYELTDSLSLTAGLRYTDDTTKGDVDERVYYFDDTDYGEYLPPNLDQTQHDNRNPQTQSDRTTWLAGVDYKPTEDTLLYGKYARGYRQGSVNIGGSTGADIHNPEKVDTYEAGFKGAWMGELPATFNVAAFYNDFQDQQLQFGYFKPTGVGTTAVVNAGASTIYGLEADGSLQVTDSVILSASYAYLDTNVDEFTIPTFPPGVVAEGFELSFTTAEDEPLAYAPENKFVASVTWLLPVDASWGDMAASATYVFTDDMRATGEAYSKYYQLPSYDLVNLNLNWNGVFGSPIDLSAFVTNLTDEEYVTYVSGLWNNGFESGQVGQPQMIGARIRYNFGVN